MELQSNNKLFDENASMEINGMLFGNNSNIREWRRARYSWTYKLWNTMVKNYWHSGEVSLDEDKTSFQTELTPAEMRAFRKTISFLNYLDSIQSENLPNIAEYVTAWEIKALLNLQTFQEEVHAESYSKVLMSVCEVTDIDGIMNEWRNDPLLRERNILVADLYQRFIDSPTVDNFVRACMANYNLESIYFYSGFTFFYLLAKNGKMLQTSAMIRYIQKDELTHVTMFANMIKELRKEHPEVFTPDFIQELRGMTQQAVDWEIRWGEYLLNDEIEGITNARLGAYIKWLSNNRMQRLGFEPLYPELTENPLKWVEEFEDANNTKEDMFENVVTNYQTATEEMGWDEID